MEGVVVEVLQGVLRSGFGIDHGFNQTVGRQAVSPVQPRAGTFAQGIKATDARTAVEVDLDTAAEVMGCGRYRDVVAGDVDADGAAFGIDVGKMAARLFGVFVGDIEADVV